MPKPGALQDEKESVSKTRLPVEGQEKGRGARVSAPGKRHTRPREREYAWLHEHAAEYPGQWIALAGGRLIAADPDVAVVLAQVRRRRVKERPLLHFQPKPLD